MSAGLEWVRALLGRARAWLRENRLVLATGMAAALPVLASTVRGAVDGWLPLGDDAVIAVRSFDVLSTHPPLLGQYSASSQVIGEPVHSLGPMLYWLLALPVRVGGIAPAVVMGLVSTAAVVGTVALARRRGGAPLMFAVAAGVALMSASLEASIFHDVWNPSAGLLPFTLLLFLAWSLGCGDYRLLPLTALVASFVFQCHLTYALAGLTVLAIGIGFMAAPRPQIPRRWLGVTAAIVVVCWSLPALEMVIHRPGNVELVVEAGTAEKETLGANAGWRSAVRALGIPPWWLRSPREPLERVADVNFSPPATATVSAIAVVAALAALALVALRRGRRDAAAALFIALGLIPALALVTAATPTEGILFATVDYTLWWASPFGMFAWVVLFWSLLVLLRPALRLEPAGMRVASAVALAGVAAVGAGVAARGDSDPAAEIYAPAGELADRIAAEVPSDAVVLVEGPPTPASFDLQGAVVHALRSNGTGVSSTMPGLGTRYRPRREGPDAVVRIAESGAPAVGGPPAASGGRTIARILEPDMPENPFVPRPGGRRTLVVTLEPAR